MRARLVNAEVKRVFDTPRPPLDWGCVAVWSVISVCCVAELGALAYWLFRLADWAVEKIVRLIP